MISICGSTIRRSFEARRWRHPQLGLRGLPIIAVEPQAHRALTWEVLSGHRSARRLKNEGMLPPFPNLGPVSESLRGRRDLALLGLNCDPGSHSGTETEAARSSMRALTRLRGGVNRWTITALLLQPERLRYPFSDSRSTAGLSPSWITTAKRGIVKRWLPGRQRKFTIGEGIETEQQ